MKKVVLDTCVWVNGFLNSDPYSREILEAIVDNRIEIIISSYGVAECMNTLRRLAKELRMPPVSIERDIWAIWNQKNVIKQFEEDIANSLVKEVRKQTEILLIAKLLNLEPKDVPFIILSYSNKVPLVTCDKRSIWDFKDEIYKKLGVHVFLSSEFQLT